MIYLKGSEASSNNDILNGTRLSSIPYSRGQITIQALANLANATNNFTITVQLPDGSVPVDAQTVSAGQEVEGALGGQLDDRLLDQWSFPAPQGGHFTIAFVETGAAIVTWRVVLSP